MTLPDEGLKERRDELAPPCALPAISDYALIGDCRTAALVSRDGSIDWLCLPNFSGASIFARLLDPDGGHFSLCPSEPFEATRRYVDGTAVLETVFETAGGRVRIRDCLPTVDGIGTMRPMREILRVVEGLEGTVPLAATMSARCDYGRLRPRLRRRGRLGWAYAWGNEILQVASDIDFDASATGDLWATASISAGQRRYVSLAYSQAEIGVLPLLGADADRRLTETIDWWRGWAAAIVYDGPSREIVLRSALTLKLLTFTLSGAVIAAPTTSLPEEIGGSRNWDYRYCWLRDAGYTMEAMIGVGILDDARCFLDWLLHATRLSRPKLQIMYDVYGRTNLTEAELPHLAGYRGSQPVRIGNGAHDQVQLDVYGEVVHAAAAFARAGGVIDRTGARMLADLGRVVCDSWREPDSGIWEKRGEAKHYTFSKVMCWVALDRLLDMDKRGVIRLGDDAPRFQREIAAIVEVVESRGFNLEINAYTKVLDGDLLDASVLLMANVGYKDAGDPRLRSTLALIDERLARNGLLSRYEPEPDDNRKPEGSFGICNFWAVEQLALRGDWAEAETRFDRLVSLANDVGLFAEEFDVATGDALGNFPQAFTHVGLINAALAIAKAKRQPSDGVQHR